MFLHNELLFASGVPEALQDTICRLCEAWWHLDLPCKAEVAPKMMPFVLVTALTCAYGPRQGTCISRFAL